MREQDFLDQVIELSHLCGWLVAHQRPARTEKGWRTAVQGDAGFPDLVMVRAGELIFAELKSERGKVTPQQQKWIELLGAAVWRPSNFDEIREQLRR